MSGDNNKWSQTSTGNYRCCQCKHKYLSEFKTGPIRHTDCDQTSSSVMRQVLEHENSQTIVLQSACIYQVAWSQFTNSYETVNKWFVIAAMGNRHPGGVMFPKTKSLSLFTDTYASGPDGISEDSYLFFDLSLTLGFHCTSKKNIYTEYKRLDSIKFS